MWIGATLFFIGFFASGVRALDYELGLPISPIWNPMTIIGLTGIALVILAAVGRYRSKVIDHFL